jgi:hypothetical protein
LAKISGDKKRPSSNGLPGNNLKRKNDAETSKKKVIKNEKNLAKTSLSIRTIRQR